jgi:hypothetical protein
MKYFIYTVIAIVVITIIAGFFVVGSPKEERLHRSDEQRVSDLSFIQSEITNFWQNKERLPQNLDELTNEIRGVKAPRDPETDVEYEYRIIDEENLIFELCAIFSLSSPESEINPKRIPIRSPEPFLNETWQHGEGHTCFERTIDPDFFKPIVR